MKKQIINTVLLSLTLGIVFHGTLRAMEMNNQHPLRKLENSLGNYISRPSSMSGALFLFAGLLPMISNDKPAGAVVDPKFLCGAMSGAGAALLASPCCDNCGIGTKNNAGHND